MPSKSPSPERFVALLRGINVGGKNVLPMKSLAELMTGAGARDVETYIQSGNVVFTSSSLRDAAACDRFARAVEGAIQKRCGFTAPVVLRRAREVRIVASSNPFLMAEPTLDPKSLHVGFLREVPDAKLAASLDPGRSLPDRFILRGGDLFLCLPSGVARSKLTNAYFDAKLKTVCTVRNWATVQRLDAMASGRGESA